MRRRQGRQPRYRSQWCLVGALVAALALLTACGSGLGAGSPPSSAPVSSKYGPIVLVPARIQPTAGRDARPVTPAVRREAAPRALFPSTTWDVIQPEPTSTTLRIAWGDGVPGCDAVDVIYLTSDNTHVIIDLSPETYQPPKNCAAIALSVVTTVQLDKPLGNRTPVRHGIAPPG